ncbi:hypothetical protein [Peptostreptococcus canis]|uniref:Uncharacterized protein n=1 Tax=Peptostreptococcus canis TaxID=1159213 RepID=A0ABR6TJY4_9FIRM|nr:hypothetical protein [Peptostreptococcus canis]MBC2575620.1 hypothetical protein [Peptostreptococcus canis]MBP1997176.1 serine/threonine protein phosphatase PrpC [Peptostreptococcus canis]
MSYKIINIKALCTPGTNVYNEDISGFNENYVWIIDGATGLSRTNHMPDHTDARWYSYWWDNYLRENATADIEIDELIKKGIKKVREDFTSNLFRDYGIGFSDLAKIEHPSASIAIVKLDGEKMHYLVLGDCRIYTNDEKIPRIADESVSKLDEQVFESMKNLNDFGYIHISEIRNMVKMQIIENRLKYNTDEGYWILSFDEKAVDKALKGTIELNDNTKFMMATDGYHALSEKYKMVEESELLDKSFEKGLAYMLSVLREFENDEEKVRFIPRFKDMDDCTSVIFECVKE